MDSTTDRSSNDQPAGQPNARTSRSSRVGRMIIGLAAACALAGGWFASRPSLERRVEEAWTTLVSLSPDAFDFKTRLDELAATFTSAARGRGSVSTDARLGAATCAALRDPDAAGQTALDATGCSTRAMRFAATCLLRVGAARSAARLARGAWEHGDPAERSALRPVAARAFYEAEDDDLLFAVCRDWLADAPEAAEPRLWSAKSRERRSEWLLSADDYRAALARLGDDGVAHRAAFVDVLIRAGEASEARAEWDRLARESSERVDENRAIEARLLVLEGRFDDAGRLVDRILAERAATGRMDDVDTISLWLVQGSIHLALNRPREALAPLHAYANRMRSDYEVHHLLGGAYARLGDHAKKNHHLRRHFELLNGRFEIVRLQRELEADPTNEATRARLSKLYELLGLDNPFARGRVER